MGKYVKRHYKLTCKKCGQNFVGISSKTALCPSCNEEERKLVCVVCDNEFIYEGRELKNKPLLPVCNDCYDNLPVSLSGGNTRKGFKDSIRMCDQGHLFRGRNYKSICPICEKENRTVHCDKCGKEYYEKNDHYDRIVSKQMLFLCDDCKDELPGEGVHIRKCYSCGEYFKADHNFKNCPVCGKVSIAPVKKTCDCCGKEYSDRDTSTTGPHYCKDCKKILSKSRTVKSFEKIMSDENFGAVRKGNVLMLPITATKQDKKGYSKKKCPRCDREFFPQSPNQTNCACCYEINTCKTCGFEFINKFDGKAQSFCSNRCSTINQMKEDKENGTWIRPDLAERIELFNENNTKSNSSIEIGQFEEITDENIDKFNIPGVWGTVDKDGFFLDIHLNINVKNEYLKVFKPNLKAHSIPKYIDIADNYPDHKNIFLSTIRNKNEGFLVEMMIYMTYGAKYWNPAPGQQAKVFKYLKSKPTEIIVWDEIKIGDEFMDKSRVKDILDWETKKTYKIHTSTGDLVVSFDHMIEAEIYDPDNKLINSELEESELQRLRLMESSDRWVCAEDLYNYNNKDGYRVLINNKTPIIEPFGDQTVRCIQTDTGEYTINDIKNHNCARTLFYGMSDMKMMEDCEDESSHNILTCSVPGGFCEKCARKAGAGRMIDVLKKGSNNDISQVRIGGVVSTNLSEPLTQSYLNSIHSANDPKANQHKVIVATFEGYRNSPVISNALEGKTTAERRQRLYEGLKEVYADQKIDIDDWNLQAVAKKMTSYKRNPVTKKLEYVEDGELCDIASLKTIGNIGNIFKKSALGSSYKNLSKGGTYQKDPFDSFNDLMIGTGE